MGYIGVNPLTILLLTSWDIQVIFVGSKKPKVMLHRSTGGEKHVQEKLCFFCPEMKRVQPLALGVGSK